MNTCILSRLKAELEYLDEQRQERLAQLERQKDQLAAEFTAKLSEVKSHGDQEVTRLKALHEYVGNRFRTHPIWKFSQDYIHLITNV